MSIIGNFGLCSEARFRHLVDLIKNHSSNEAEALVQKIYHEFENSASKLEESKCSGEVFTAVFDYFKSERGIEIWKDKDLIKVSAFWRENIGGYDMLAFTEKEKIQLLSLESTIDYHAVAQYVNDFFAYDYEEAGQIACKTFFENLKRTGEGNVLIWYIV